MRAFEDEILPTDIRARNPHQKFVDYLKPQDEGQKGRRRPSEINREVDEEDPELLDKYDSFYITTKSLLVLFQIMGVMPIERSGLGNTTFSWFSFTAMYAYFLYASETVFVSIVFKERLLIILEPGKRFDEYIYGFIFLSILIPHFLLPIAAWTNGNEVAIFKNMWTRFQVRIIVVISTSQL